MIRLRKPLLAALLFLSMIVIASAAFAAGTAIFTLSSPTFSDLGPAPVTVENQSGLPTSLVTIIVADARPSAGASGSVLAGGVGPRAYAAADSLSHVWAAMLSAGSTQIAVTPVVNRVTPIYLYNPATSASPVTISNASPAVIGWPSHGLSVNQEVVFSNSGGALNAGLTAGTVYYVISAGLTSGAFEVSATVGGSAINTSGAGSGTQTATAQSEQYISAAQLASATNLAVPPGATVAEICVETAGVRYRERGLAPTASIGMPVVGSTTPNCLQYAGPLTTVQFIAISGSPTMDIFYYAAN